MIGAAGRLGCLEERFAADVAGGFIGPKAEK
jgi:hypothetical protein